MKKIFTLVAAMMAVCAQAQTEKYEAVTFDGEAYTASAEFANAVIAEGKSVVTFGTDNMNVEAVGGTTAKDVYQDAGSDFAGWQEWNDVKWDVKNQGDITFGYIQGTGNPAMEFVAEEVLDEDMRTGHYRAKYTYYTPDCGKMPVMGLYYKFTAKSAGDLKIYVWSNKGNRNTYLVDEATTKPVAYKAEGYINGQTYKTENGDPEELNGKKKWLTSEEIQAIHDAAKLQDLDGDGVPETDSAPYCIGAGNQPFWGTVNYTMTAGQTVWIFQDSSQIGFQGYEFAASGDNAINTVKTQNSNAAVSYNLAGQKVSKNYNGIVVKGGKKYIK